jgi:hypothetical protein
MICAKAIRNRSPLDGSGEWFGRLGWHEQNALNNSVSHTQHSRRQKGTPKINSHPKSQGFSPHRPETLQRRILQIHDYRRIIISLQKNHGGLDTALGTVKPIKFVAAHDVGQAINPMLVEGQMRGGIAQGIGMALMEEYIPDHTENLHDYLIPTIGDVPTIETMIIEEADLHGPYGAKGLGEHVLIPTVPALLNAIKHATGLRLRKVPATPSAVQAAIKGVAAR